MSKYTEYTATTDIEPNKPVMLKDVSIKHLRERVENIVTRLKEMLKVGKIHLPNQVDMEISSHHGLERFEEMGAVLIKVVNREYCKMLLVMFPGQDYPMHTHKLKEESLHILYGDLTMTFEGSVKNLKEGDVITVERGVKHAFKTNKGVIIEEVSTTYFKGDSYYEDISISKNDDRKVELTYWVNN
jgi:N-acetylneuraminate synthase